MKRSIFWILFSIGFIPFIAGFLGKYHWILDGFSHFRVYYGFYFLVLGLVSLLSKQKWVSTGSIVLSVLIFSSLVRFYVPQNDFETKEEIKILSMNLLSSNNNFEEVIKVVSEENPDIVLLQEINSKWNLNLKQLEKNFPFKLERIREDNFGMTVLSKVRLEKTEILSFSEAGVPSFYFQLSRNQTKLNFITTHPLPPVGSDYFEMRNEHFINLNAFLRKLIGEVVVVGDLNSTSFSPNFNKIIDETTLRDSRFGYGLQNTWNAKFKLISIAIDHVLVSDGVRVFDHRIGRDIGSDHLPVIITVGLN